jgi:hypothetical protein
LPKSGRVKREVIDQSHKLVSLAPGWLTDTWVVAEFEDSSGTYPPMRVRAELLGKAPMRPAVTRLAVGDGTKALTAAALHRLASILPGLSVEALLLATTREAGAPEVSEEALIKALAKGAKRKDLTGAERQDLALGEWESHYKPQGFSQAQAAADMGMKLSTFASYLTHARRRREARDGGS